MVVKKRKKNTRLKGTRRWGWGRMHRGSGQQGGAGASGTGKKAHCKKPSFWGTDYFGKHGFKMKGPVCEYIAVNIKEIEDCFDSWQKKGFIAKKEDKFLVDLEKAGYTKLLSTGRPTRKYLVKVECASKGAIEKIKKAGGTVETEAEEVKTSPPAAKSTQPVKLGSSQVNSESKRAALSAPSKEQ